MIKKIIYMIAAMFILTGCSIYNIDSQDISTDYFPPKQSAADVVYLDEIYQPHFFIAYVTVNTERNQLISDVIEKMKREAAILGGDAITNIRSDATGTWKKLPAQQIVGNGYVRANFTASVVKFQ